MKRKSITIREDQEEYVQSNHLNLSRFVQDKLDEYMQHRPTPDKDSNEDKSPSNG